MGDRHRDMDTHQRVFGCARDLVLVLGVRKRQGRKNRSWAYRRTVCQEREGISIKIPHPSRLLSRPSEDWY